MVRTPCPLRVILVGLALLAALAPGLALEILVAAPDAANPVAQLCLQGLANRAGGPLVYLAPEARLDPWLPLYRLGNQVAPVPAAELSSRLKGAAQGQVLYDPAQPFTVNIATTLAGAMAALATDRDLGLPTVFDCHGRWRTAAEGYRWAIATLMPSCSKTEVALLPPDRAEFRDYAVKNRLFVFDPTASDPEAAGLLGEVARRLPLGARMYSTAGPAARKGLGALLSPLGHYLVPVTGGLNFSFHSSFPATAPLTQAQQFYPLGQRLVTFIFLGGEDQGYDLGLLRLHWEDPVRGTQPAGWTISPTLATTAPLVLQYYLSQAQLTGNDYFLMAPSGPGFFYPSAVGSLQVLMSDVAAAARNTGLTMALVMDEGSPEAQQAAAASYLANGKLRAVFLPPDSPVESQMVAGKPIVRSTFMDEPTPDALLRAIRKSGANLMVVLLDPSRFSPLDLAATIAHMSTDIYTILPPGQFAEAVRALVAMSAIEAESSRAQASGLVLTPEQPQLGQPLALRADVLSPDGAAWVQAIYSLPEGLPYTVTMASSPDGTYRADLPPLYWPGEWSFLVRVTDGKGGVALSEPLVVKITGADTDQDGLADVLEDYLRTDREQPDSDGDGLLDGNDRNFLTPDRPYAQYLFPVAPPGDMPFLVQAGGSTLADGARQVPAGGAVTYRLPLGTVPPEAPVALQLLASGPYSAEVARDDRAYQPVTRDEKYPPGTSLYRLPAGVLGGLQLYVRITAGEQPAAIWAIGLGADPEGPYLTQVATDPAFPAPGLPTFASAQVFAPRGIAQVRLHYRVNGGPVHTTAAATAGGSQVYRAAFTGLTNGDLVTYWLDATAPAPAQGSAPTATSAIGAFRVGTTPSETISLLGLRDFMGTFTQGREWDGNGRWALAAEAEDTAKVEALAGSYEVWLLGAPRGSELEVLVDDRPVGRVAGDAPDGWQRVGALRLAAGSRTVKVRSLRREGGAASGYGQVLLTADPRLTPPAGAVLDTFNSVTVFGPGPGEVVSGAVLVTATATGNVQRVQFLVDGTLQRAAGSPPYSFRWSTRGVKPGEHLLQIRALDRNGEEMLTAEVPVVVGSSRR